MEPHWEIPRGWGARSLADIAPENSRQTRPADRPDVLVNYWSLDAINKDQFVEPNINLVRGSEIQSTCVEFDTSHVLYGKLRPYLNKVIVPSQPGVGSTEWVPLRPIPELLDRKYLACVLRTKLFVDYATSSSTGARMPRASKEALRIAAIPLPYPNDPPRSLAEQRRIVARLEALLGEVRELRRLQAEIEADVGRLMEAALAEVFDDQNEWPTVPLGDVFKFRSELVRPNDGTEGELTFVGLQHIASGTGIKLGEERLDAKQLDGRKFRFSPGQILYGSLRPYLNKVWIADCEGICSVDQFVLCPQTDHVDTAYLAHYLRSKSFLRSAQERSSALDLPRIRRDRLVLIEMPLPPVAEQRDIAHYLNTVTSGLAELKSYQNSYATAIEPLEQSILAQAFRGEL